MSGPDEVTSSSAEIDAPRKPRNLILCSDGTGQRATNADGTNVWRVYQALDREHTDPEQLAIHEDGVGSSSNKLMAALGGGMGFGLARNVRHLYSWLCANYQPGDRIYLFGFSRGAFTVRCLAGMITRFGVLKSAGLSPDELHRFVGRVWMAFKDSQRPGSGITDIEVTRFWTQRLADKFRDMLLKFRKLLKRSDESSKELPNPEFHTDVHVEFVGVWDTVDAYGLPVDELKEAFARASRIIFPWAPLHYLTMTRFNDRTLSPKINNAYHAIAIDDERHTFHPVLWDQTGTESRWKAKLLEPGEKKPSCPNLQQVWFVGMHADVGGGYPRGALSLVPLDWMMTKAEGHGLHFTGPLRAELQAKMSPQGPMHDSRSGTGAYYRYKPRPIEKLCRDHKMVAGDPERGVPVVHESVLHRIKALRGDGAPAVLPVEFQVVRNSGEPKDVRAFGHVNKPPNADCVARLTMLHWRRRFLYFLFVLWTVALLALLAVGPQMIAGNPAPPWRILGIGYLMSVVQRFTPGVVSDAIGTLRGLPFWTLTMAAILAFFAWRRHSLVGQISQLRRAAWNEAAREKLFDRKGWRPTDRFIKLVEKVDAWRNAKEHEKVFASWAVVVLTAGVFGFWAYSWFWTGVVLPGDLVADAVTVQHGAMPDFGSFELEASDPALAIGPVWQRGQQYRISVQLEGDWGDGDGSATATGRNDEPAPWAKFLMGYRDWRQPAFALLGSIGSENGQTFLIGDGCVSKVLSRDTRLFVFVNDRVCYWCPSSSGAWEHYDDNNGRATIRIERVHEATGQSVTSTCDKPLAERTSLSTALSSSASSARAFSSSSRAENASASDR